MGDFEDLAEVFVIPLRIAIAVRAGVVKVQKPGNFGETGFLKHGIFTTV
ncbi:MAG: hypothetical protein DSM106950_46565 [Stigonema ocellatum SAG 48.90 = DSM 106950]|nr:hypothetical protein [Stigonema ocellatum SAG 48.90 = DSM 106950]